MPQGECCYTVGVFQNVASAEKAIEALERQGFPAEALSIIVRADADAAALIERILGGAGQTLELRGVGAAVARGPLVSALGGESDLTRTGLAANFKRVGFQAHDGRIFETLVGRGGVLVAVLGQTKAADALAVLHSYGGGNAAIGVWGGRVSS